MIRKALVTVLFVFGLFVSYSQQPYKNKNLTPEERADDLVSRLTIEEKEALMMNNSKAIPRLGIKKYDWWNEALHGVARNGLATVFPQAIGMAASFDDQLLQDVFTIVSDEARVKHRIAREKGENNRYKGLTMWTPNINIFRDPRWGRGQETYGEDPYLTGVMAVAVIKGLQGENINGIDKLHACAKHYAVHSGPEWNRHSFNANDISPRDLWETYLPAFKVAVQKGNVKEIMCAYNRFEGEPCCGSNKLLVQILRKQWEFDGIVLSDCGAIRNFYMEDRHMTHPDSDHAVASAILTGTDLECGSSYKAISSAVTQDLISEEQINISLKRLLKARFELGEMDSASPWDSLPDSLVNCTAHKNMALNMAQKSIVLLKNNGILPLNNNYKRIALLGPNADDEKMQWGNYNGIPEHTITLLEALNKQLPNSEIIYDKVCDHTGITESAFDECKQDGKEGFKAVFWNNTGMTGEPIEKLHFNKAIKIGKRDTISKNINIRKISAKFQTTFTPKVSGEVEFVFTTASEVKLYIDGKTMELKNIPPSIQMLKTMVEAGRAYIIEIDWKHEKKGQFRFDIIRNIKPDLVKMKELVKDVDVVIFAGGITARLEREEANIYAPGFMGGDRTNIELPEAQRNVITALKASGKKVVLVNFSGSAMGLTSETKNCDAIVQAWYPGEAGGKAIVNILFGNCNPAGRLPVTFYKNVEQLPEFENYNMKGRTYRYMKEEPLFPFGFGLSYTIFKYGQPVLDKREIKPGEHIKLTIPVTNTGNFDGEEVVQVYLKKTNDVDGPNKALRAFKRVAIRVGETLNVVIELTNENLEWWDEKNEKMHMHAGEYQLMIGGSSSDKDLCMIGLNIK